MGQVGEDAEDVHRVACSVATHIAQRRRNVAQVLVQYCEHKEMKKWVLWAYRIAAKWMQPAGYSPCRCQPGG